MRAALTAADRVLSPDQESLGRPGRAKIRALAHPSIWNAAHTGSLHPNKIPCRSSVEVEKVLSSPFDSVHLTLHASGPRIAGPERLTSWPTCFRSAPASPSSELAPKQPARAISIPDAVQEVVGLRRPPADKTVMSEKAAKPGGVYQHSHQTQLRIH